MKLAVPIHDTSDDTHPIEQASADDRIRDEVERIGGISAQMKYTPEMLAMIEAQREHFASDDHIQREAEPWRDASPEERLAAVAEMCAAGDYFLSQLDPETLDRLLRPVPLPEDTIEILMALRQSAAG